MYDLRCTIWFVPLRGIWLGKLTNDAPCFPSLAPADRGGDFTFRKRNVCGRAGVAQDFFGDQSRYGAQAAEMGGPGDPVEPDRLIVSGALQGPQCRNVTL